MDIKQVLAQVPRHIFYLKNYNSPIDLSHAVKALGMTRMIYAFSHVYYDVDQLVADILKYGQGADYEWQRGTYGSRIYRQAGNLPGWGGLELQGPNGKEMKDIVDQYTQQTGRVVHKDDVGIMVWDFTNFSFPSEQLFKKFLEKVENYLIENYQIRNNGKMPVGNIKTEAHAKDFSYVDDLQFNSLFKIEM
jgi:hypothetical protein